jgi:hypothetical protein
MQALELGPGVVAQLGIQIGQRLVQEEQLGAAHQGASDREALLLAAGERVRLAHERVADAEHLGGLRDAVADLVGGHTLLAQRIGEVVEGREVRVEREGLEDHGHPAPLYGRMGDVLTRERDGAPARALQPGDAAQGRGLAGSARAENHEEFARGDVQINAIQRVHVAKMLGQPADLQLGHLCVPSRPPAGSRLRHCASLLLPLRMVGVFGPNATPRRAT